MNMNPSAVKFELDRYQNSSHTDKYSEEKAHAYSISVMNMDGQSDKESPEGQLQKRLRVSDSQFTDSTKNSNQSSQEKVLVSPIMARSEKNGLLSAHEDSLRLPQGYQGDRFIPLRSGNSDEQYELQYQHEENMLQFQTQKRKSKTRKLLSPNSEQSNEEMSSGSKSKGSPNEEKNKQIYQNLVAMQCLGEEIFSMQPQYENLSNPMFNPGASQVDATRMRTQNGTGHQGMSDFLDQQSIVSNFTISSRQANDINSSPSTMQTQSK